MKYSRSIFCMVIFACFLALWVPMMSAQQTASTVNINTATATELATLKNIGPALSQRIVQYREENGSFQRAEDIMKVTGVGQRVYDANVDRIRVEIE